MVIIDGKSVAEAIVAELKEEVAHFKQSPGIAFIRVGENPASIFYVKRKQETAKKIGIYSQVIELPEDITKEKLYQIIEELNRDSKIHGILIQSPLPKHLNEQEVFNQVSSQKDVDGFTAVNLGLLCQENPQGFVACTPAGILELLKRYHIEIPGKHVVVLGRSLIVGKPAALLMQQKHSYGNATVTICHSRTQNLKEIIQTADILIAAIGSPHFVTKDMVKPGAVVIDVGINKLQDENQSYRLVGDVNFEEVSPLCSYITPVPGGVGPMTVAMLMKNTIKAYKQQHNLKNA